MTVVNLDTGEVTQLALFDYNQLDTDTAAFVRSQTTLIKRLYQGTVRNISDIGHALITVKDKLNHGQFTDWLQTEFTLSERTAQNYMNVARNLKTETVADLNLPLRTLYLLAAPSTSDEVRDEALKLAANGDKVTHQLARQLVEQDKERRTTRLAESLDSAPAEVVDVVTKYGVAEPDTVDTLTRLHERNKSAGSSGTFDEIAASGFIQPGDEPEAVPITARPLAVAQAVALKSDIHREIGADIATLNGKHKPKTNRAGDDTAPQGFDLCQTPPEALDPLLPYLRPGWTLWEPARGEGLLVEALFDSGFVSVLTSDIQTGENFLDYQPDQPWDCQITNPPYSLKYKWLERSYALGKPFALLLPVETLGAKTAQELFREHGVEVIFMDRRINFKMPLIGWEGSAAQFPVAWFTWGLSIGHQMTFARMGDAIQRNRTVQTRETGGGVSGHPVSPEGMDDSAGHAPRGADVVPGGSAVSEGHDPLLGGVQERAANGQHG